MSRCDLPCAMLAALLMLVSLPGAARAGPLEDAEAADRKDEYATAIPIYRSLAEKGDVSAQMRLGFFYESGAGLKRDWVEFAKWFSKAADAGDESAVFVLSFHFHMIPLGWRGASPNSLRAACAVADGMDSLGDLIEIPQGLLVPAYLAIALPAYTPLNTNSSEWRALEERFFVW